MESPFADRKAWINAKEQELLKINPKDKGARMKALMAWKKEFSPPTTPTKFKESAKPTIRTMDDIKTGALPNPWAAQPRPASGMEIRGITRDEYEHGIRNAQLVMQEGSYYARAGDGQALEYVCSVDDPDAGQKTQAVIDRNITWDMNGAPQPTRLELTNEHFGSGASQCTLKEYLSGHVILYPYSPSDWHDWARCAIELLRRSRGNEEIHIELIAKARRTTKCPYWDALLDKWMILVQKILYSNEIDVEVFSRMMNLLEGFTTGDFMFLKSDLSVTTVHYCNLGWDQINEIWGADDQWPNQEGLIKYRDILNRD